MRISISAKYRGINGSSGYEQKKSYNLIVNYRPEPFYKTACVLHPFGNPMWGNVNYKSISDLMQDWYDINILMEPKPGIHYMEIQATGDTLKFKLMEFVNISGGVGKHKYYRFRNLNEKNSHTNIQGIMFPFNSYEVQKDMKTCGMVFEWQSKVKAMPDDMVLLLSNFRDKWELMQVESVLENSVCLADTFGNSARVTGYENFITDKVLIVL